MGKDNHVADWLSRHPIAPSLAPAIASMSPDDSVNLGVEYKIIKDSSSLSNQNKPSIVLNCIGEHQQRRLLANDADNTEDHLNSDLTELMDPKSERPQLNALVSPKTRPNRITAKSIKRSQETDPQLRWVLGYLSLPPDSRRDRRLLMRQMHRVYLSGGRYTREETREECSKETGLRC